MLHFWTECTGDMVYSDHTLSSVAGILRRTVLVFVFFEVEFRLLLWARIYLRARPLRIVSLILSDEIGLNRKVLFCGEN